MTLSQRQMVSSKIRVNQWRNEPSSREQLGHHLGFTKSDDEPQCCDYVGKDLLAGGRAN